MTCHFPGCSNKAREGYSFYEFSCKRRRLGWLDLCGLPQTTPVHAKICEGHFSNNQFQVVDVKGTTTLKPFARPNILIPNPAKVLQRHSITTFEFNGFHENGDAKYLPTERKVMNILTPYSQPQTIPVQYYKTDSSGVTISATETKDKENKSFETPKLRDGYVRVLGLRNGNSTDVESVVELVDNVKRLEQRVRDLEEDKKSLENKAEKLLDELKWDNFRSKYLLRSKH